jgi:uncharacterized protein YceK
MVRKMVITFAIVAGFLLLTGCSTQVAMTRPDSEPMRLHYDINYVDNTAVSVDLMVIAPETVSRVKIARELDETVNLVVRDLPKSELLGQQDTFLTTLSNTFAKVSRHAENICLVVLGVNSSAPVTVAMR